MSEVITYKNVKFKQCFCQIKFDSGERILISIGPNSIILFKLKLFGMIPSSKIWSGCSLLAYHKFGPFDFSQIKTSNPLFDYEHLLSGHGHPLDVIRDSLLQFNSIFELKKMLDKEGSVNKKPTWENQSESKRVQKDKRLQFLEGHKLDKAIEGTMTYEEFIWRRKEKTIDVDIESSVAIKLLHYLPKRYKSAYKFGFWIIGVLILGCIYISIFWSWWVGLLLTLILTPILINTNNKTASQFILKYADGNKDFFDVLMKNNLLLIEIVSPPKSLFLYFLTKW